MVQVEIKPQYFVLYPVGLLGRVFQEVFCKYKTSSKN